jgi:hypothetical protein
MKVKSVRQLMVFILILTVGISVCDAQNSTDRAPKPERKGFFGLFSGKKSSGKVQSPKSVSATKKEQEKKKKKEDEDYAKSLKESQKRSVEIQTPDVQERMKQNQKEIKDREKAKKKRTSAQTKKAGRKYKK